MFDDSGHDLFVGAVADLIADDELKARAVVDFEIDVSHLFSGKNLRGRGGTERMFGGGGEVYFSDSEHVSIVGLAEFAADAGFVVQPAVIAIVPIVSEEPAD